MCCLTEMRVLNLFPLILSFHLPFHAFCVLLYMSIHGAPSLVGPSWPSEPHTRQQPVRRRSVILGVGGIRRRRRVADLEGLAKGEDP